MAERDYYDILGISRDASKEEIKKAYRRLAMRHHPDRNSGDKQAEGRLREVNSAYEALSDPEKRAAYDRFGHAAADMGGIDSGAFNEQQFGDIFGGIFSDIFGGRRGRSAGRHGRSMRMTLEIDLQQAMVGGTERVSVPILSACDACGGTGSAGNRPPAQCGTCHGAGMVRVGQGFFTLQQTCPACHGEGQVIAEPCTRCQGQGRVQKQRQVDVHIPAGVDTGDILNLAGAGEAGPRGGAAGDLHVEIAVRPHPIFRREGIHLHCDLPVSVTDAALGGEVEVPTMGGPVRITIPPGTQGGRHLRVRGKGIAAGGRRGDLFCAVAVETPVALDKRQQQLLRELAQSLDSRNSPQRASWLKEVKDFFRNIGCRT